MGTAVIRAALVQARALGERVVVIGHPAYYPRFGFASARAQGLEAPFAVSDAAFMALDLVAGRLAGEIGTVRYPPAWDAVN